MMTEFADAISKISPTLGAALGGPAGALVGAMISKSFGTETTDPQKIIDKLQDPANADKLKELEIKLTDLQDAREEANKEVGAVKLTRPFLAIAAMGAVFVDLYMINYVQSDIVQEILVIMLVVLVWDIRQIYKFYFGSGENLPFDIFKSKK